jgi:hypothetical protein
VVLTASALFVVVYVISGARGRRPLPAADAHLDLH